MKDHHTTVLVPAAIVAPLETKESGLSTAVGSVSTPKVEGNHVFVLCHWVKEGQRLVIMVVRLVDVVDAPLRTFAAEARILNTSRGIEKLNRGLRNLIPSSTLRMVAAENAWKPSPKPESLACVRCPKRCARHACPPKAAKSAHARAAIPVITPNPTRIDPVANPVINRCPVPVLK